ncbi:uridine diphosphate glucose pyrophosphatase NUDT14-like [Planococcus citri]|uniref:uridine diphosphate glucose pyrophosphatase NUDT14-like n=1 Tax=Planococcus citri TaxID=170843 RepID=UPI0031F8DDDC
MEIKNLSTAPLGDSLFIKPMEIRYTINGHERKWDYIECHNSVAIIIFNVSRRTLVCVKQFRPAVYVQNIPLQDRNGPIDLVKYPPNLGITVEFCAGIVDKNKSLREIAKEEVLEETGYDVSIENLHEIKVFKSNVGTAVDEIHLFYTEVDDSMKKGDGGGLEDEGEYIEVVELTLEEARQICEQTTTLNNYCGFLYGLLWFLHNKSAYFHQTCSQSSTLEN